jgi:hypothetical protein
LASGLGDDTVVASKELVRLKERIRLIGLDSGGKLRINAGDVRQALRNLGPDAGVAGQLVD